MEHLEKQKPLTDAKPNDGLKKSTLAQRQKVYTLNQTQPILMEKLYSVTVFLKRLLMEKVHPIICSVSASNSKEVPLKTKIKNYIGIDIASEEFTATIFKHPDQPAITRESVSNSIEGFKMFCDWLKSQKTTSQNSIICTEATSVYGEALIQYLATEGFKIAVEPPLKVKRAFYPNGHKNDRVDSVQIAEYAYRFFDQLRFWQPPDEQLEKLKHFLSAREQLVKQSVAVQNVITAYKRHILKEPILLDLQQKHLSQIKEHIATIDQHIVESIQQNPSLHQLSLWLVSLCGIGTLLAAYLLVITNSFQDITNYKQCAAFLGICPYQHKSGKSIYRQDHCRPFGPPYVKKLLRLAARSVIIHHSTFRKYYLRKVDEGKNKSLVLNNVANKLLKISFALVKHRQSYIPGYRSVNPMILKTT